MSKSWMYFTCCLIVLFTMCIDVGNGNSKKKYREVLQKDIVKFKEIAEKIEDEIEDFYDDYTEDQSKNKFLSDDEGKPQESFDYNSYGTNDLQSNRNIFNIVRKFTGNSTNNYTTKNVPSVLKSTSSEISTTSKITLVKDTSIGKENTVNSKWPKFEDLLRDMGKKYDWKNDRWIKVKKKVNQTIEENHSASHERHKFNYRTVKLNRSKSRRNVVIAVTAVR